MALMWNHILRDGDCNDGLLFKCPWHLMVPLPKEYITILSQQVKDRVMISPCTLPGGTYHTLKSSESYGYWILCLMVLAISCTTIEDTSTGQISSIPESNRFVFEDLVTNLNEPMELDFLPNGNILFIERRGLLKMYDDATKIVQVVGEIPVHYVNENGLLGMAIDPDFVNTAWIYFFYTDPVRKSYQHISRFEFRNDQLVNGSEQRLLDFYIDYDNCCHFGGSLAFGPDGNLFISSGDNVGGKDYAPIDERPGRKLHDSQRTSANTNDLRGSILRIRPEPDGAYSIPEGNLFPIGIPDTRPEIYVMGARNPLKIEVDRETGWLYWGDVGPNPGWKYKDWGPPSYEEINQAKEAGNYGWPYLLGDNQAFRDVDFENMQPGDFFDPNRLVNNSPNNTGIQTLPPAQKALIWYPNTESDSFPLVGTGGGTICAGQVYHYDPGSVLKGKWPRYFDKKLFIYEWMRSWMLAVTLDEDGSYLDMENPFKKPIDMAFSPEGAMYVLDYGSNWYAHNPDARLTRISYEYGNRAPHAHMLVSRVEGAAPLEVTFDAEPSFDEDRGDRLKFTWHSSDGKFHSTNSNPSFTFKENGTYQITLLVTDQWGLTDTAVQQILVGNEPPYIELSIASNQSFFFPNQDVQYQIRVVDQEDGNTEDASIDPVDVKVTLNQLKNTTDLSALRSLPSLATAGLSFLRGKTLMETSDCYACHALDKPSVGPSLMQISERYLRQEEEVPRLTQHVILGSTGIWGEQMMSAHPQHSTAEVTEMVQYILTLSETPKQSNLLSLQGSVSTEGLGPQDLLVISANYTDQEAGGQPGISREIRHFLRPTTIPAVAYDDAQRVKAKAYNEQGDLYAEVALNGCYIGFKDIDLTGVEAIRTRLRSTADWVSVDLRRDSAEGELLDSKKRDLGFTENKWAPYDEDDWFDIDLSVGPNSGVSDLYFVFNSSKLTSEYIYYDICQVLSFQFLFAAPSNL